MIINVYEWGLWNSDVYEIQMFMKVRCLWNSNVYEIQMFMKFRCLWNYESIIMSVFDDRNWNMNCINE